MLWDLEASLESQVAVLMSPDYARVLDEARSLLRDPAELRSDMLARAATRAARAARRSVYPSQGGHRGGLRGTKPLMSR